MDGAGFNLAETCAITARAYPHSKVQPRLLRHFRNEESLTTPWPRWPRMLLRPQILNLPAKTNIMERVHCTAESQSQWVGGRAACGVATGVLWPTSTAVLVLIGPSITSLLSRVPVGPRAVNRGRLCIVLMNTESDETVYVSKCD